MAAGKNVWKRNMLAGKQSAVDLAQQQIRDMKRTFRATSKEIQKTIDGILASVDGNLANAKRLLSSSELSGVRSKYTELVTASFQDGAAAQKAEALLERLYKSQRVERMEAQLAQIDLLSAQLYEKMSGGITESLTAGAKESYYRVFHTLETTSGTGYEWNKINVRQLNVLISENWSGKPWSDRLWGHVENFDQKLKDIVTRGALTGSSINDMKLQVMSISGQTERAAETLVRTEMGHVTETATAAAYEETGVERYQYLAELDLVTSDICRDLDGMDFAVADRMTGLNYPPMHPNCRSTTVPFWKDEESVGLRAARDPETGKSMKVPADWDYKKWYEERVKDNPKAEAAEQALKNRHSDEKQFDKYQTIFGKKELSSFAEFQEMKYNDTAKWNELTAAKQSRLNSMEYSEALKEKFSSAEARGWYKAHVDSVADRINLTEPIEAQAREAHSLRNQYKEQARKMMSDLEERKKIDDTHPIESFDETIARKMKEKYITKDQAIKDTLTTAAKSNKEVNKMFGLEE